MPYRIEELDSGKFKVVNKESGNVHSKATSRSNAEAQVRLLHGVEHGMKPRTTKQVIGSRPTASSHSKPHKSAHKAKRRRKP